MSKLDELMKHQENMDASLGVGYATGNTPPSELAQGRLPAGELLDGALLLAGGVLLLTPGFFTDFLGLFFLVPVTRSFIRQFLGLWLQRRIDRGTITLRRH